MAMGAHEATGIWAGGIAENIARIAEAKGTTKHAVMEATGIPRSTFYRKLNDHPERLTVEELAQIAGVLGVTVPDLLKAA